METLGTQVPRSLLTNLQRELHLCRLPNEPPFLFCPPQAMPGTRACHLFLLGRGVRDAIVMTGGTQTPDMPGTKGDT